MHRKRDLEARQREHDANVDPENPKRESDVVVLTRAEDRSVWFRATYYMLKYLPAWLPTLITALLALGFRLSTPAAELSDFKTNVNTRLNRIESRVDTVNRRVDTLSQIQAEWRQDVQSSVSALIKLYCYDARISQRDKRLSGIVKPNGECLK